MGWTGGRRVTRRVRGLAVSCRQGKPLETLSGGGGGSAGGWGWELWVSLLLVGEQGSEAAAGTRLGAGEGLRAWQGYSVEARVGSRDAPGWPGAGDQVGALR